MNPYLDSLEPYPFSKLRDLFGDASPADKPQIRLSVGEPQHAPPEFVLQEISANLARLANYPATAGMPELRQAIARWLQGRFQLRGIDAEQQVLPVNGTREALFAFAQAVIDPTRAALVVSPNPFYQIYEGAALLAGARPHFLNCRAENGFIPDFDAVPESTWQSTQLLYLCSPGNPTGAITPLEQLQKLVALAREHDFIIASDECYSEIYMDESSAPPGLLQACAEMGDSDYRNCVVFHSLSKRSNLPGLRSGFVAGDAAILRDFLLYRTYHGCAMPPHHQLASIAAWGDEEHVRENRRSYREKFSAVLEILDGKLDVHAPPAGFYLWPKTPVADTEFALRLYEQQNVVALPGSFLAREAEGENPGELRLRLALVAPLEQCVEAAQRIVAALES
ncbi:MAG: succinyldiaminopimelate transaminase [Halioglobus sp.]|nr:succinyldiaminopimelate transaminase [Halioglobus sp.]